jgi:hypothetical protein
MSPRTLLFALAALITACPARQPPPRKVAHRPSAEVYRPYTFTLDGRPFAPFVYSQEGEPDRPRPGDAIIVDHIPVRLGEQRVLRLVTSPRDNPTQIHRIEKDGSKRLVALNLGQSWYDPEPRQQARAAFTRLSVQELRDLQGLVLNGPLTGLENHLRHLDPRRICLGVTEEAAQGEALRFPVVPGGHTCLMVEEHGGTSDRHFKDFTPLETYRDLRLLIFKASSSRDAKVDLRHLTASRGLRVLDLSDQWKLTNPEALVALSGLRLLTLQGAKIRDARFLRSMAQLRWLDLSWTEIRDLGFVRSMPHLRRLDLSSTGITDLGFVRSMPDLRTLRLYETWVRSLAPLAGLSRLVEVDASSSKVAVLPAGHLPALRRLNLLFTPVTSPQASQFRRSNPGCDVSHGLMETLRRAVAGADRVRVSTAERSGFRVSKVGRTILDRRGTAAVAEILDLIEVRQRPEVHSHHCCRHPVIDLLKGDRLVARLGYHHGRDANLSWSAWPESARLTEASSARLAAYLSRVGYLEPAREVEEQRKDAELARYRRSECARVIPAALMSQLLRTRLMTDYLAVFQRLPRPEDRVRIVLRLLGCSDASWNYYQYMYKRYMEAIPALLEESVWSVLLTLPLPDMALTNGAANVLFRENLHAKVAPRVLSRALLTLARAGWSHPRASNRHITLAALGRIGTPAALEALRVFVRERPVPRPLAPVEQYESDGWVDTDASHQPPVEGASELAHAAYLLAKLGDRRSATAIRQLAAAATGADRTLLKQAVELIDRKPARAPTPRR